MVAVHVAIEGADLCAEDALVGQRERIDDRDVEAALARRGRELAADPSGAHDDDPATAVQTLAQRVAVLQRAQVMDAAEFGARDRDPAWLRAGGQQQPVVVIGAPVGERNARPTKVDRGHGRVGLEQDLVVFVEALLVNVGLLARGLSAEVVLGQRWPLIRALWLGADQQQAPVEPLGA